jgi:translation initiation factor eIF-2B subunit delta
VNKELEFLISLGIEVIYTHINGVSCLMSRATKVIILARCMFSNGYLLGKNGSSLISCLAHNYKKRVIALCETIKFSERSQMDSFLYNNITLESHIMKKSSNSKEINVLSMKYDLCPSHLIDMIICESGFIPTTSVPVIIREFGKEQEFEELEKELSK